MFGALDSCRARLRQRYAEPHRAYHTQLHIDAMLAGLGRTPFTHPDAAELAVWFHDAIYDPAATDNEARSAALLHAELGALLHPTVLDHAARLILCTADHTLPPDLPPELAADAAAFLDLDMAVLGGSPAAFDRYERGIAAEFIPVHGAARFAEGRRRFLSDLLARPRLFLTAAAHATLDAPARANIRRTLGTAGPQPAG